MDQLKRLFLNNWQRKIVAIMIALVVWLYVNHSLIITKTISNIPVRVINIPQDKTIIGLLPNGLLTKRVTLTLSGTKDIVSELEPGDLEVLIDASLAPRDEWIANITKKNLVSLNPSTNLRYNISEVAQAELFIRLSPLVTDQVPIIINTPKGNAPDGYEFLDVWPQKLYQTLSGPKEEIENLKVKGLELTLNLDLITESELNALLKEEKDFDNEVSLFVPVKWKMLTIPFRHNSIEEINDKDAVHLRIDFLRKEFLPVDKQLPLGVYYPIKYSETINPNSYPLASNKNITLKNHIPVLNANLYLEDVSRLFLSTIRDYTEIVLIVSPKDQRETLRWAPQVFDMKALEDIYTGYKIANAKADHKEGNHFPEDRELQLRKRFRKYMHRLTFYTAPSKRLNISSSLKDNTIEITGI